MAKQEKATRAKPGSAEQQAEWPPRPRRLEKLPPGERQTLQTHTTRTKQGTTGVRQRREPQDGTMRQEEESKQTRRTRERRRRNTTPVLTIATVLCQPQRGGTVLMRGRGGDAPTLPPIPQSEGTQLARAGGRDPSPPRKAKWRGQCVWWGMESGTPPARAPTWGVGEGLGGGTGRRSGQKSRHVAKGIPQ